MKKFILAMLVAVIAFGTASARDKVYRSAEPLPEAAKTMLAKYFPKLKVNHVKVDSGVFDTDYDVILSDGTEVDFNKDGEWESVERNMAAVPDALIPAPIMKFVKENYGNAKIYEISKDRREYEISLSNGLDLKFDRAGNFKRIDD